jgi:hypothetical protein
MVSLPASTWESSVSHALSLTKRLVRHSNGSKFVSVGMRGDTFLHKPVLDALSSYGRLSHPVCSIPWLRPMAPDFFYGVRAYGSVGDLKPAVEDQSMENPRLRDATDCIYPEKTVHRFSNVAICKPSGLDLDGEDVAIAKSQGQKQKKKKKKQYLSVDWR